MTSEQFKFFKDLERVVGLYGVMGRKPDQYGAAERLVREAGLYYDDLGHNTSRDNPVIHAVVQLGGTTGHATVSGLFLVFEAMEYYLRKKAEADERLNCYD